MARAVCLTVAAVVLGACTAAATMRPPGSPVPFALVVQLNGPATTTVTVTDRSGLVDGVTSVDPTTLGLSTGDWDKLTEKGYVVVGISGSNDIALLWNSGVCYPQQTVSISGAAKHLNIDIQLIPPGPTGGGSCILVGGGPALRLAMAAPIDLLGVAASVQVMGSVPKAS